jgi:hypothetical protein
MSCQKKYKKVDVLWSDAYSTDAWTDLADVETTDLECLSSGWLVKQTKDVIVVAGTINTSGMACCMIHIPRGMVKKITPSKGGQ